MSPALKARFPKEMTIVMQEWVSILKQQATQGYGAEVILQGRTLEESLNAALDLSREGRFFIHPYDDPVVIAGQGTVGLEIIEDLPEADRIVVPVGGGGLIAGVATAVSAMRPGIRVVGVEAEACPCARRALEAGCPIAVKPQATIADGIRVGSVGRYTYPVMKEIVERVVCVDEDDIAAAILLLLDRKKVLAEGAGATPLAALLSRKVGARSGERVVLVISGGNLDAPLLGRLIRRGMIHEGRILRFSVSLPDVPNELARMLAIIAELRGNILHLHHARGGGELLSSEVEVEVETAGHDHSRQITETLLGHDYQITVDFPAVQDTSM
jgi:threonine dehydratase